MDHVRPRDVDRVDNNGATWVLAGSGGISTNEIPGPLAGHRWGLEAGYDYGDLLLVWNDHDRHWSWESSKDMRLADFEVALRASHPSFIHV